MGDDRTGLRHERRLDGDPLTALDHRLDLLPEQRVVGRRDELEAVHARYLLGRVADDRLEGLVPPEHPAVGVEGVDRVRRGVEQALDDRPFLVEFAFARPPLGDVPEHPLYQPPVVELDDARADLHRDVLAVGTLDHQR